MKLLMENWQEYLEEEEILMEKCWAGYEKKGMKKMFGKMYPNCVKKKKKKKKKKRKNRKRNEEVEIHGLYGEEKNPRIPRKKGQPAKSKKHSDLYTDEDPKGTIHGLGYKDESTARASVTKIRNSGRSHAHKTQAAIAMEQRAKAAGKSKEAAIFRKFIEQQKKKTKAKAKKK
tara:strand:- start:299 stop:817 length:519 start_codon:yes stop_codon:yes gene_type:complete